jgi:O-antigen/teichoic acid export membrane protein
LLPLYTALLTPEDYGILSLLETITAVSLFVIISGTDTALGYYYYRKEFSGEKKLMVSTALWLRIFFSIAGFLIILFGSHILSRLLFGRDYSLFVTITGLCIIFSSIYYFLFDLLRFEIRPWLYTIISTGLILVQILLNIYFVLILKQGVYGVLVANGIGYFVFFCVTVIYVFSRYGFGISKKWVRNIFSYGFPLIGTGIAVWVLSATDRYFLAHYADLSAVGIYSVGMKLASIIGMVAGALQLAWGPFAMSIQYDERAKLVYRKVFLFFFLANIIGVFFVSMFSIDILKVFTQPAYYSAKAVVPFLCMSTVLSSAYFIVCIGIALTKKAQHTIWIYVIAAIINILMNYFITPVYGAIGASFSIMIAYFIIFLLTLIMSQKYYPIEYDYFRVLSLFIPAAIIVGLSYYLDFKILPRSILSALYLIFSLVYLYVLYKDSSEFKIIVEKLSSLKPGALKQPDQTNIEV